MGAFSFAHWLVVLISGFVVVFPTWKILQRLGFTGWWSLLSIVPVVNLIMLWIVALTPWPIENQKP